MDLSQAIEKHAEWKIKFRTAITKQETMDANTIAKDNCCMLGQWLYGEGKTSFSNLQSFKLCVDKHATFHSEAEKVALAVNAKKYAEAEAMLAPDTPYSAASTAVGMAIMRLKKESGL